MQNIEPGYYSYRTVSRQYIFIYYLPASSRKNTAYITDFTDLLLYEIFT